MAEIENSKTGQRRRIKRKGGAGHLLVESLEHRILLAADVAALSPADDSTDVAVDTNLVATFSDPIRIGPGTGNIEIRNVDSNSLIEAINVRSDQVTIDGATLTIDPSQDLPANTNISIQPAVAKVRDLGTEVTTQTIFFEDFEGLDLRGSTLVAIDNYVLTMTGTLDVTAAGEYTFGVNSDDGQALYIDVNQDGLDIDDFIIEDDSTHGRQDRLSTCGNDVQECVGTGDEAITLAVGQYDFLYYYFEAGGGSGGEFFYAPGTFEAWDAEAFVLVGDASKGIGVVDGITATTYKEAEGVAVGSLADAEALQADETTIIGTATLDLADVAENRGGRFSVDNTIPGLDLSGAQDWTDEAPFGWVRDNSFLEANRPGGQPEYNGWTFLSKDFWIQQQGDQDRTAYTNGEGTVAVVDPDAFDDFVGINSDNGDNTSECEPLAVADRTAGGDCGYFTAGLSTPPIYLDGVAENSATLMFDSSWRDETTQSAEATVEYFDGDGNSIGTNVLLRWESIQGENYKPRVDENGNDNVNEEVVIGLNNPADAASLVVTFTMPYAQNDWWWAIDNIEVTADVEGVVSAAINDNTTWNFRTVALPDITQPGDPLIRVDGENDGDANDGPPPAAETVEHVIDDVTQKYLNFLDLGSGFIVTPSAGDSIVTGLRLYTANDAIPRDPASYVLEGGPAADGPFTVISAGDLALPDARNAGGQIPIDLSLAHQEITFENSTAYTSYRLTFPTLKDAEAANSMQIAEVEFLGEIVGPVIDLSAGTAAQSSQLGDFVAGNALDDVVNFTHTLAGDENPTWQVLLPSSYAFDSVTVFNRGASGGTLSCCPSRLRDITIQIVQFDGDVTTDFTGGVVTSSSPLLNPENVIGGGTASSGPISLSDSPDGAVGNLIRVIRTPDDDLSGTGGQGNNDEGSVLSIDLVVARGVPVGGSSVPGDVDGNGKVEFADFLILAENFGKDVAPNTLGDIDGNGKVEFSDFLVLAENFGKSAAPAAVDAVFASLG